MLLSGVALLALTGCSSSVEVAEAPLAQDPACTEVARVWPQTVGGQELRDTSPSVPSVRAWGDPAIVARCGVPALPPTTQQCIDASGIDWVAEDLSDGVRLTTFGRDPAIEVLVPNTYAPAPLLLPAFADAAQVLPKNGHACV